MPRLSCCSGSSYLKAYLVLIFYSIYTGAAQEQVQKTDWYITPADNVSCANLFASNNNNNEGLIENCHTLNNIISNSTLGEVIFQSNSRLIFLPGEHEINLQRGLYYLIENVSNISLIGSDERRAGLFGLEVPISRIVCKSPFGLSFVNVTRLALSSLTFSGCGTIIPQYLREEVLNRQIRSVHVVGAEQKAALFFINIFTFQMVRCFVDRSVGYGLLGVNIIGDSAILATRFVSNNNYTLTFDPCQIFPQNLPDDVIACSGGNALFVYEDLLECPEEVTDYTLLVQRSIFILGVNQYGAYVSDTFLTRGTGIGVVFSQSSYGVKVTMDATIVFGNTALMGANIYIVFYDRVDNSTVRIIDSNSSNANNYLIREDNYLGVSSGVAAGLYFDYGVSTQDFNPFQIACSNSTLKKYQEEVLFVSNSNFLSNYALLGAGAYVQLKVEENTEPEFVIKLTFEKCTFSNNRATSGSGVFLSRNNNFGVTAPSEIIFREVTFVSNGYVTPIRNLTDSVSNNLLSVVQLISTDNVTLIDCKFLSNEATALTAFESNILISGTHVFQDNSGVEGGALDLQNSFLYLKPNTRITFSENYARHRGGAINVIGRRGIVLPCFYQVEDPEFSPDVNITLFFEDNFAEESGSALYGGSIERCFVSSRSIFSGENSSYVFDQITSIGQHSEATSVISSDPVSVCSCVNNVPNCDLTLVNVSIYLGQTFQVSVVTVGQRNGVVPSTVFSTAGDNQQIEPSQQAQRVEKICTNLNYTVSTNRSFSNIVISTGNLVSDGRLLVSIEILPCPLGFVHSTNTKTCACDPILQFDNYNVTCNLNDQTVHRIGESWINASFSGPNGSYDGIIVHNNCPYDYCSSTDSDVDLKDPDKQCNFNRTGILCGACKPGLSHTLATSRCAQCSNTYLVAVIGYALAGIALVVVIFLLNLTVSVGTLGGIIFYANMIRINQFILFPPGEVNILTVFIAWLNLDSGLDLCFSDGLDGIVKIGLGYAIPMYIWLIVGIIILLGRRSSYIAKLCGSQAVSVLALLLLLSYTKMLRIVILSLSSTTYVNPDGSTRLVWSFDGNVGYWKGKHIPLAIMAHLILYLFLIPYTFLLILAPLSCVQSRTNHRLLSWINKLKPFLDAHYSPYKDSYRNWIGLLLLLRVFLSTLISVNFANYNRSVILLINGIVMFLVVGVGWVTGGGVYKKWPHNLLECSFFLNYGILLVTTLYVSQAAGAKQEAAIGTSVGIALVQFVCILIYHIYKQVNRLNRFKRLKDKVKLTKMYQRIFKSHEDASGNEIDVEKTSAHTSSGLTVQAPTVSYAELREPLLED